MKVISLASLKILNLMNTKENGLYEGHFRLPQCLKRSIVVLVGLAC